MNISLDKQYKTRGGRNVRLYAIDGPGNEFPVHGAWQLDLGCWEQHCWRIDGSFTTAIDAQFDLIENKPQIICTFYCIWLERSSLPVKCESSRSIAILQGKTYGKPYSVTGPHAAIFLEGEIQ